MKNVLERLNWYERVDEEKIGSKMGEFADWAPPKPVSNIDEVKARMGNNVSMNGSDKNDLSENWTTIQNTPEWRAAELMSANLHASARGLAKIGAYMA